MGLNQEYLEFALFKDGLSRFSPEEWEAAGFTEDDQFLVQYMMEQEIGHIELITNILGGPGQFSAIHLIKHSFAQ